MTVNKNSFLNKTVSLVLVFAFAFYNISFAVPENKIDIPDAGYSTEVTSVEDIGIAIDHGTIKSKYDGGNGKVIVHIQDAHCNFEAQNNINSILEQVTKECGIDLISVEGAEGIVDTAWFRAFPDAEIRKEVATYFMKKGEITGAEFFSIISDYEGTVFGAETREYYIKNLKAFTEVYPYKDIVEKYFTNTRTIANRIKSIIYPSQLKEIDLKIRAFDSKDIELSDYAAYLYKRVSKNDIELTDCDNFNKLLKTLEYEEKIDFDVVDAERSSYIDVLSKKLSKEQMTDLVTQSIRFKKGHIKAVKFYIYLRELAKTNDIPIIQEYPNLFYYYIYTKLYDGIDNEGLFKEIDIVEARLKEKLFTDEDQKKLDKYTAMLDMFIDLVNIELTNDDYDIFNEYSEEFTLDDVLVFLGSMCDRYNLNYSLNGVPVQISSNIPRMIDFYEIAMKRDNALISNTLAQMKKEGKDRCVLIAGGFHTRGIKNLLEEKGVSYVVVTPKITKDVDTPYIKVLTNQRTSLEDIITESAAMPGVAAKNSKDEILQARGEMLAAASRMRLVQMYMSGDPDLSRFSAAVGKIGENGMTLEEIGEERHTEIVTEVANRWLDSMESKADPQVWAQINKDSLMGAYLMLCENSGITVSNHTLEVIAGIFKNRFKNEETTGADGTPGVNAIGKGLSPAQARALDKILVKSFKEKTFAIRPISVGDSTFDFVLHYGLKERIEEFNKTSEKVKLPLDIHVHPGRGGADFRHGLLQGHLDARAYAVLTDHEREVAAWHELAHLEMYNDPNGNLAQQRDAFISAGSGNEEDFVDSQKNCNSDYIRDKLDRIEIMRYKARDALDDNLSPEDQLEAMQDYLRADVDFGYEAYVEMERSEAGTKAFDTFVRRNFFRRYNIDLMKNALLIGASKDMYDIIVISSSTKAGMEEKGKRLEQALSKINEIRVAKGMDPVIVESVLVSPDAGQIVSHVIALEQLKGRLKARGLGENYLEEILSEKSKKIAFFHDGGQASRFSPITMSLFLQRGWQGMAADYLGSDGTTIEMDLFTACVLNSLPFGATNDRGSIDTFWTSQLIFPTIAQDRTVRSGAAYQKFYVPIDWQLLVDDPDKLASQLFQFGTCTVDENGYVEYFFTNKEKGAATQAGNKYKIIQNAVDMDPDRESQDHTIFGKLHASKAPGYDYGSFSMNNEMTLAWWKYWMEKKNDQGRKIVEHFIATEGEYPETGWERALDPEFTRPLSALLRWFSVHQKDIDGAGILSSKDLQDEYYSGREISPGQGKLEHAVSRIRNLLSDEIFTEMGETKGQDEAYVTEVIEFILLYKDNKAIFPQKTERKKGEKERNIPDYGKVIGAISLGEECNWMTYRDAQTMGDQKLRLLTDAGGKYPGVAVLGSEADIKKASKGETPVHPIQVTGERVLGDKIFAAEKRKAFGVSEMEWCDFYYDGTRYVLPRTDVADRPWVLKDAEGKEVLRIYNSLVKGCVLQKGSDIRDSVVDKSHGKIISRNSYVHDSVMSALNAKNSFVHKVYSRRSGREKEVIANGEILTDVVRTGLNGVKHSKGHTRLKVPMWYMPKISDGLAMDGNEFDVNTIKEKLKDAGVSIKDDMAKADFLRLATLICSGQKEALVYELDKMESTGYRQIDMEFVNGLFKEFDMKEENQIFRPNSRARSLMVWTLKKIQEKYGTDEGKTAAKERVRKILEQGVTIDPNIFRRDSVRAEADLEMPDNVVKASGKAYVELLAEMLDKDAKDVTIAIGRESRVSGPRIMRAFIDGAVNAGARVIDATNGADVLTSTPLMYFSSRYLLDGRGEEVDGIVEITASHLPWKQNGFKPTVETVNFTSVEMKKWEERTHDVMDSEKYRDVVTAESRQQQVSAEPVIDSYYVLLAAALEGSDEWLEYVDQVRSGPMKLKEAIEKIRPKTEKYIATKPLAGMRFAADSGFGSTGPIAAPFMEALGAEFEDIGGVAEYSKNRIKHDANPNNPDNLKELVAKVDDFKANFGMGFDVDGDRLGVVTRRGQMLRGDDISCIIAPTVIRDAIAKAEREGKEDYHPVVVMNVLCSDRLKAVVEAAGGILVESGVGFNTVKQVMAEHDAVMGVEISSHIMFRENFDADDAFFAVVKLLGVLRDKAQEYKSKKKKVPEDLIDVMLDETNKDLGITEDHHTGEWRTKMVSNDARVEVSDAIKSHYAELARTNPERYSVRNTLDGIKVDFLRDGNPVGFLAVRPSGTSPEMVVVVNSLVSDNDFKAIKADFFAQLKVYKDKVKWTDDDGEPNLEPMVYYKEATVAIEVMEAAEAQQKEGELEGTPGVNAIKGAIDPDTPLARVVDAVEQGKPVSVQAYEQEKVWGVDGIGEYWYGAEEGEKSSQAVVGSDSVPMADVMAHAADKVLGEDAARMFGHSLPLVKILTPKGRLSVQFHDTKNELWIVTGIDETKAGENPSIIHGFSPRAVGVYGDEVPVEYQKVLKWYGEALNTLIDVLENGRQEAFMMLNETGDAVITAELFEDVDPKVKSALDSVRATREKVEAFYNYRPVQVGDVIPIPAGTLHALGAGIEVVEPQIAGDTQSLEDGATYPVRYYFPGYERTGAQKMLDIHRVDEMTAAVSVEASPVVIAEDSTVKVERLPGSFEDKGLEVHRITLADEASLDVTNVESFHNLVVVEGKAKLVMGGEEYDIPKAVPGGDMLIVPATAGSYRIVAEGQTQIIDTFTPVPETHSVAVNLGENIPGPEVPSSVESVVYADFPGMSSTFDQVYLVNGIIVPEIIQGRPHEIVMQEGAVRIERADGTPVTELMKGEKYAMDGKLGDYKIVKTSTENAVAKIDYENTDEEKIVYETYAAVRKHLDGIKEDRIDLIMAEEMFVRGGKNVAGSAKWEEEQLKKYVSDKIRVTTYSARMGLKDAARKSIRKGAIAILVAPEENIREADRSDKKVQDFLYGKKGKLRVMAIPDIHKEKDLENKGWFFNREVEGTALLLAAVNPGDIKMEGEGNAADDLQKLMGRLTGKEIPRQFLYYMLARDEMGDALDKLPDELKDDAFGWLVFLVQEMLLKMPIKPYTDKALEQLNNRRKIMWSV
ncbi:MAG: hypothetical protein P9L88_04550 [Candidatus Tantalella remota]|nr:hypothetical protein [Candidatus Tantalella remota]